MKLYHLNRTQFLPISVAEAWDFFSSPKNLSLITPKKINFEILSISGGDKMHARQLIQYKVSVLPFLRVKWVTEISQVEEPVYFTDEQKVGPFSLWRHTHSFTPVDGGVEMSDAVDYALPLGVLGVFAYWIFVRREVNAIFDHRHHVLEVYFKGSGAKRLPSMPT